MSAYDPAPVSLPAFQPGDRVEVILSGVPEWNLPGQHLTATVTADNAAELRRDAEEQATYGGAQVKVNGRIVAAGR